MIFLYFSFLGAFFGKPLWCWNSACLLVTVVVISQTKPSLRSQSIGDSSSDEVECGGNCFGGCGCQTNVAEKILPCDFVW